MWRSRLYLPCGSFCLISSLCCRAFAPLAFKFAQSFVIAFFAARHDTEQVMAAAPHIPLEERAATLRINVEVLYIAFDKQFVLGVAVKIGKSVGLPVTSAMY